ncbi:putative amidase domain-containing protein [Paenibacillus sp. 32O-W]|uniref:amidase domain-containing protein n=1 Tax=Paenibacillus sp. 32O-W TaxID=1695218 RepID=UPI0007208EF6|nr:amidase domain-containing protein [Paenibacillus sp. 32O-W]ALS30044.1 putative amidase domain-containing protein [Paenibacillus sp. 32O-W]
MPRTGSRGGQRSLPSRSAQPKPAGWKEAVREYVRQYNQGEIDQHVAVFDGIMSDHDHRYRLDDRLRRLRDRELLRGALPAASSTKTEVLRVQESPGEVSVLVGLHIKRTIDQRGREYTEERCERERLWLSEDSGRWIVTRVEPWIGERRPRYGPGSADMIFDPAFGDTEESYRGSFRPLPAPYLNYDLLPSMKRRRATKYRRDLAAAYADRWWNEPNPAFEAFAVNCTNYVSQCIFAGNAPMNYTGRRESGWWYKGRVGGRENWSFSWAVSHALHDYLSRPGTNGMRAVPLASAAELKLGDVIIYDWNGDGRYQHTTIVTAFDADGMPLVNANTVSSRHRYWDYQDSYAWTEQTRYRFFHIADEF